jgi:hypothetical protein
MQGRPNITNRSGGLARGAGAVTAGFASMVAGLCLGSFLADARADRTPVRGVRREVVLRLAHAGPAPLRQAAMAALADGVVTVREERHLYLLMDQIRGAAARYAADRTRGTDRTGGADLI